MSSGTFASWYGRKHEYGASAAHLQNEANGRFSSGNLDPWPRSATLHTIKLSGIYTWSKFSPSLLPSNSNLARLSLTIIEREDELEVRLPTRLSLVSSKSVHPEPALLRSVPFSFRSVPTHSVPMLCIVGERYDRRDKARHNTAAPANERQRALQQSKRRVQRHAAR